MIICRRQFRLGTVSNCERLTFGTHGLRPNVWVLKFDPISRTFPTKNYAEDSRILRKESLKERKPSHEASTHNFTRSEEQEKN